MTGNKDRLPVPYKKENSNLHCPLSEEREKKNKKKETRYIPAQLVIQCMGIEKAAHG